MKFLFPDDFCMGRKCFRHLGRHLKSASHELPHLILAKRLVGEMDLSESSIIIAQRHKGILQNRTMKKL